MLIVTDSKIVMDSLRKMRDDFESLLDISQDIMVFGADGEIKKIIRKTKYTPDNLLSERRTIMGRLNAEIARHCRPVVCE